MTMNIDSFNGSFTEYFNEIGYTAIKLLDSYESCSHISYLREAYRVLFRDLLNSVLSYHDSGFCLFDFDVSGVYFYNGVAYISPSGYLLSSPEGVTRDFLALKKLIGIICYYPDDPSPPLLDSLPYDLQHFFYLLCSPGVDTGLLKRHVSILNVGTRVHFLEALTDQRRFFPPLDRLNLDEAIGMYATYMTQNNLMPPQNYHRGDWRAMVGRVPGLSLVPISQDATADPRFSVQFACHAAHHMVLDQTKADEILTGVFPHMCHIIQWYLYVNGMLSEVWCGTTVLVD